MGVPQLNQSCCGCNLQTGSKIIGWFHLVVSVIAVIVTALQLSVGRYIRVQTPDGVYVVENIMYSFLIALMVGVLISLAIAICLLVGAYNRSLTPVLVWVVYNTISSTIFLIATLYSSGKMFSLGATGPGLGNLFGGLIALAIQCYFLLVTYSFYRELKNGPQNIATYNAA